MPSLVFTLLGLDAGASAAIAKVGAAAAAASDAAAASNKRAEASMASLKKTANIVGAASAALVVGVAVAGVKAATSFEQAMAHINTQAGVSTKGVAELSKAVLNLAPQVGIGPDELAQGLYHIESAFQSTGISGQKALDILKVASEGAKVGGADLVDVTNALDAAIVSGIPGVQNYSQAMGALNKIVGSGDMTLQDLADAFGTGAVAVVKNYGLSLTDVGAALATFGDNNIRGANAGTQLRMVVQSLAVPAAAGTKNLQSLGLTTKSLADDMQKGGLNDAVKDLETRLQAAGITGSKVGQFLTDTFGKKAGVGLGLIIGQFDRFESKFSDITKASNSFASAWAAQSETTQQKLADLKAAWDVFLIKIGDAILPDLKAIADVIAKHPGLIEAAAAAVGLFAATWATVRFAQFTNGLAGMAKGLLGIGKAAEAATGEAALGGVAGKAEGAATEIAGVGTALGGAGLLLGGAAVLGIAGIAGAFYEISNDIEKFTLPSVQKLSDAILKSGRTGKDATALLSASLNASQSGDNRGESIAQYTARILKSSQNTGYGISIGDTQSQAFNTQNLQKVLQTGSRTDFNDTIGQLQQLARATGANSSTVQKLTDYYTALFNRLNSGRQVSQNESNYLHAQAAAAEEAKTKLQVLDGTYGLSKAAQAAVNKTSNDFATTMVQLNSYLTAGSHILAGNSQVAIAHRSIIATEVTAASNHAKAVYTQTGNLTLANKQFQDGIGVINSNAAQLGYNTGQVHALTGSLAKLPGNKIIPVTTPGLDSANAGLGTALSYLQQINDLRNIAVNISAQFSGNVAAASQYVTSLANHGKNVPGDATGGFISGAGSGTSDSILRRVSNGEFIVNAQATSRNLSLLNSLNSGGSPAMIPGGTSAGAGDTYYVSMSVSAMDSKSFEGFLSSGGDKVVIDAIKRKTKRGGVG